MSKSRLPDPRSDVEVKLNAHIEDWKDCTRCPIGITCNLHVFHRGDAPADMLVIGEAPGPSEDAIGEPFLGPAGRLLSHILREVKAKLGDSYPFTVAYTNTICCFPLRVDSNGNHFRTPTQEEVKSCIPRMKEYLKLMKPRMVVLAGTTAQAAWEVHYQPFVDWPVSIHAMHHPSHLLRQGALTPHSLVYSRTVNGLIKFVQKTLQPS